LIVSLHVATGAAAGALTRSRLAAAVLGPVLHAAGDAIPHHDIPSRRFEIASGVDDRVKQAAMKKLFADPHFNVMDGLDTYIDDYGKPDPIPESMLRRMAQAQFLGLFSENAKDAPAEASPDGEVAPQVPQSSIESPAVPPDENADLRLQQDDAAGRGGAGEGPAA